jgi:hypothetical protein
MKVKRSECRECEGTGFEEDGFKSYPCDNCEQDPPLGPTKLKLFDTGSKVRLLAQFTMLFLGAALGRAVALIPWPVYLSVATVTALIMGHWFTRWCDELSRKRE